MLICDDYDLSLSLGYEEPVKEALKETILRQEYTFKNQGFELHRLYYAQKTMMNDMRWMERDGIYFNREVQAGNPKIAFGNCIRPSSMPAEKRICSNPKVLNWLQEQRSTFPEFQRRLSNPQIRSTHYFDHIGVENLNKRDGFCNTRLNSVEKTRYYRHSEEVNLSLGIGRNDPKARTKTSNPIVIDLESSDDTESGTIAGGRTKTWSNIIDLEESNQTVSNVELKPRSPLRSTTRVSYSGYKRDYESTLGSYFVSDGNRSYPDQQSPFAEGLPILHPSNVKGKTLISEDVSATRKIFSSDERAFLDLNKSISDDPSSTCSSNWRDQNDNCSNETSASGHQRILNSETGSNFVKFDKFSINLNLPPSENMKPDLTVKFLDRDDEAPRTPEMKSEKSKEDELSSPEYKTQEIVEDTSSDKSPSSCKSSCFENFSSGIETMQCSDQNEKTSEVDGTVIRGAVSLIYLALECSEPNTMDKIEGEGTERPQPQCSSDTFEEMVLKQPECSVDDFCVTSNAFEVNGFERKGCGITLKRGRRMKDFQRDIMPSLATLSRHEIWEDVKIMETALKSREYKKLSSKMTGGHKWFNPVRNRRSRLNYVGRKHYS